MNIFSSRNASFESVAKSLNLTLHDLTVGIHLNFSHLFCFSTLSCMSQGIMLMLKL